MSTTGIFNVQDYGIAPTTSASLNTSKLQTLVNDLLNGGSSWTNNNGGTISFPSTGVYKFDGPININAGSASLIFAGTSLQTLDTPLLQMTVNSDDLFVVNNSGMADENIGGIVFQDLQIGYASGLTAGAAIRISNTLAGAGSQNIRIVRLVFQDCPQGVVFQNTLEALVDQCTFTFSSNFSSSAPGVAITMDMANTTPPLSNKACNEILVRKCNIRTLQVPNTWIGVAVYACQHATIENSQISGLHNGILVKPSSVEMNDVTLVTISDCNVGSPAAALTLMPASPTGSKLREVRVRGSSFSQSPKDNTYTSGGIVIGLPPLGTDNSQLDTVKLIGVTSQGWTGPGLFITGGQNIQIVGGTYAGNGTSYAGIAIAGPAANISMVGVDQRAAYPSESAQLAALSISGNPTTVLSKSCTMVGYSASPIEVAGSPTDLQIFDAASYNDQNTPLNGGAAPTSAVSASNCTTPYFGPSIVTFSHTATVTVTINGQGYLMSFGSIYLAQPTDTIRFSAVPSTFTWIGK